MSNAGPCPLIFKEAPDHRVVKSATGCMLAPGRKNKKNSIYLLRRFQFVL
jgi:hypothetical protein